VFSFTRVYAFEKQANTNPVIDSVLVDGRPVSVREGIVTPPCAAKDTRTCKKPKIDVVITPESWEERPMSIVDPQRPRHELIYATYYFTRPVGMFDVQGRVLYDANKGKVLDVAVELTPAEKPGDGRMWIIVQDNRNGASFIEVPVHVRSL